MPKSCSASSCLNFLTAVSYRLKAAPDMNIDDNVNEIGVILLNSTSRLSIDPQPQVEDIFA